MLNCNDNLTRSRNGKATAVLFEHSYREIFMVRLKAIKTAEQVEVIAAQTPKPAYSGYRIAVLLPCYNEELTIGDVVKRFRAALPAATVYVYDNNSKDLTSVVARAHGAVVVREPRQGKGNVVRRMFSDIDADLYIMADGDGTYAPEDALKLLDIMVEQRCDMVVGTRNGVTEDAGRKGHGFGNKLFNGHGSTGNFSRKTLF